MEVFFFDLSMASFFVSFMELKNCTRQGTYFWFVQEVSSILGVFFLFVPGIFLLHVWRFWIVGLGGNNSYKGNLVFKMIQCFLKKVIKIIFFKK